MSALTVSASADTRRAGGVDTVISSLPVSLAPSTPSSPADIVAVVGTTGWTGRAVEALAAGARGILVVEPVAEDVAALAGARVVLQHAFAGNPGIAAAHDALAGHDSTALLEARVLVPVGADLYSALLGQLALVRAAVSPVATARTLNRDAHGYTVHGILQDGRPVLLTAVTTDARPTSATLRILGATSAVELEIPDPVAARPLRATVHSADGATLLPTQYETSRRAEWRRLRDLITSGASAPDLEAFAADAALAAAL